jgi:hypothetical protein
LTTKPFFEGNGNIVVPNLVHTKLKKDFEFVANLETIFRFRMVPIFFQYSTGRTIAQELNDKEIIFKSEGKNVIQFL